MLTFNEAENLFYHGRNDKKKLENNTYLYRESEDEYSVVLHNTTIVRILRDGTYVLNSGGYRTITTKARINAYSPAHLSQCNFKWFCNGQPFKDGMVINSCTNLVKGTDHGGDEDWLH